jgi:hypothetical protein
MGRYSLLFCMLVLFTLHADAACDSDLPTFHSLSEFSSGLPIEWTTRKDYDTTPPAAPIKKRLMDMMSWSTFVALNWSVRYAPISATDSSPWKPLDQFPSGAVTAQNCPAWMTMRRRSDSYAPRPAASCADELAGTYSLHITSLAEFASVGGVGVAPRNPKDGPPPNPLSTVNVPEMKSPIVDQNGNKVYYEISVNDAEYATLDFFKGKEPFTYTAFFQPAQGLLCDATGCTGRTDTPGATELKFAWKVLDPIHDVRERFIRRIVQIPRECTNGAGKCTGNCGPNAPCGWQTVEVGLVGMHIAHKTRRHPLWIWSTFEQVDNVQINHTAEGKPVGPLFNDPSCFTCAYNQAPAPGSKSQLTRIEAIAQDTVELNQIVQAMLKAQGSTLQYYQLIGTQYVPEATLTQIGTEVPGILRNTVIEPYIVGPDSSCVGCHGKTAILKDSCCHFDTGTCGADYSFLARQIGCADSAKK